MRLVIRADVLKIGPEKGDDFFIFWCCFIDICASIVKFINGKIRSIYFKVCNCFINYFRFILILPIERTMIGIF